MEQAKVPLEPGTLVRHVGTGQLGTVLESKVVARGAIEYLVQPYNARAGSDSDPRWWSEYKITVLSERERQTVEALGSSSMVELPFKFDGSPGSLLRAAAWLDERRANQQA